MGSANLDIIDFPPVILSAAPIESYYGPILEKLPGVPGCSLICPQLAIAFQRGNLLSYLDLSGARGQVGMLTSCKAPGSTINPAERVDRQGGRKTSNISPIRCYWRIISEVRPM